MLVQTFRRKAVNLKRHSEDAEGLKIQNYEDLWLMTFCLPTFFWDFEDFSRQEFQINHAELDRVSCKPVSEGGFEWRESAAIENIIAQIW